MKKSDTGGRARTSTYPPSNWIRFFAVVFGSLLTYGATIKLIEVNTALSIDHWANFLTGILIALSPFIMNKFLPIVLMGTGIFTVANLLQPDIQSWINLGIFILLTVLLLQPYRIWFRLLIQLLLLSAIGFCLWCVWQEFYKGLDHFIETGKLTEVYLRNRIKTYLPGDFSYYMAVSAFTLSIRQYIDANEARTTKRKRAENYTENDRDLWGY